MISKPNRWSASRLMAVCLALALAVALPLLTSGTARADSPGSVTGLTLRTQMTPPDIYGDASALTWSDDASKPVIDQTPSTEKWALDPSSDGSFRIRNEKDGKCLDFSDDDKHHLAPSDCDSGSEQQRWFLEMSGPITLAIRNTSTKDCLDVINENNGDGSEVGAYSCHNGLNQNWYPGYINDALRNLLTLYSLKRCADGDSELTCDYKQDSASQAAIGPEKCVSSLYDNTEGADAEKPSVTYSDTTGWTNTVGGSVTVAAEVGIDDFVVSKVTTSISVNYSHSWIGQKTVSQTYPFTVRKGEWGWLTRAQLMKKVTGTWTFSKGDVSWSGTGTSTVPAEDGTDGAQSVVKPHSSPTPPTNCPSS